MGSRPDGGSPFDRRRWRRGQAAGAAFVEPAYDGEVEVGERVTGLELTTGAVIDYRLGDWGVSPDTPLRAALLGRLAGDVDDVALAGGKG
jgi:transcription elongation GreA/GreB family factor